MTKDDSEELHGNSKYTTKIAEEICERIMLGQSVREIGRADDMPDASTIFVWLNKHDVFQEQYTRAKEVQAEQMAEEMIEIADDGTNDYVERKRQDGSSYLEVDHEHIQRSKLRIETRKWTMGKLKPKKYGDKTQITGADGRGPVQVESKQNENAHQAIDNLTGNVEGSKKIKINKKAKKISKDK